MGTRQAACDLTCYERCTSDRRLVIEENAAAGKHPVSLTIVDRGPVGVDLGRPVRRAWVKGGDYTLRRFQHLAKHSDVEAW